MIIFINESDYWPVRIYDKDKAIMFNLYPNGLLTESIILISDMFRLTPKTFTVEL